MIYFLLQSFCITHPLGRVYPQDTGYRCWPNRRRHVRKPDVSFIRAERDTPFLEDAEIAAAPDLVVEVISPHDMAENLEEKIADYQSVGVPLIWVVNPSTRQVRVIRLDGSPPILNETDTLTGGDVLPGFSCRVADFLPPVAPTTAK